ncbi:3'(2'),5'-bisphosphate nucleotidase CysQ [Thiomicrorhabdus indica]|uniref:3'(2'),5'-bisphosphate nucleotidase CysQ n=1 Tax=Thiomicrorhabdus indica TaxID=2267253 RepID=UPI00102DCD35|nr:3'(2'),5'-bisphosphate nucleotidase CysQ [Thiomicrorhabdus indica]
MQESIPHSQLQLWLPQVAQIALQAGRLISQMYRENQQQAFLDVEKKKDGTPVTEADLQADRLISQALKVLTPNIPLVTEESVAKVPYEQRQNWSTFWLVDPMDGTKEFIEGTGEFSVNIALVVNHRPVLGVVYGPEVGRLYCAIEGAQSIATDADVYQLDIDNLDMLRFLQAAEMIQTAPLNPKHPTKVAVSRRHGGRTELFMSELNKPQTVKMGSALKSCLVAEGKAHVYPRFGPTSLWDTAASQVIVQQAGGAIINAAGHALEYVQTPNLLNPFFLVICDPQAQWPKIPEIM